MTLGLKAPNMRISLSTAGPSWHSSFHLANPARMAIPRARTLHYSAPSVSRPRPLNKDLVHRHPGPLQPHNRTATLLPRPRTMPNSSVTKQTYSTQASSSATEPTIHGVFEKYTGTWQYVVADPTTLKAVIIDPVLDYDPATQTISTRSADDLISLVQKHQYDVIMVLETHAHADHITAASYLQRRFAQEQGHAPHIGIGKRIGQVQEAFGKRYGVPPEEYRDVYDILFEDDASFQIGNLTGTAIHLPGHTPDHLGYHIGDNVFCGDSLFHADIGTARCDFPGGSAINLYRSGRKLLDLGDHVKIWTGHDYPPAGRDQPVPWMSVRDHKQTNAHIKDGITEQDFVGMRTARDAQLAAPRLLHPSLQINIRAGRLPQPSESGHRMLHLPLKLNNIEW